MKTVFKALAISTLATMLTGGVAAIAQDHDNHTYVKHEEWKKGYHMRQEDWSRGEHIDWHAQHLRTPPAGYEWRLVDGNYVLANINTGVISMTVVAR